MKKFYIVIVVLVSLLCFSCEELILGSDPVNTPENNFEILWKEFDLYYPSFIVRNINWDSLYQVYRPKISSKTTEAEFWEITMSLLYHFNDPHISLYNKDGTLQFNSSHRHYENALDFSLSLIENKYLGNTFNKAGEGNFTYGKLSNDSIGYLYISTFFGNDKWVKDIDQIIDDFANLTAMIIDVRNNGGGYGNNYRYIASSFINKTVIYRQEMSRNGLEHNDFTEPVFENISPRLFAPTFTKKIVILTNLKTVSASELFTLVFKQLPYCTQIGDSTRGGLSVSRGFHLPIGWLYTMPIGLTLTIDGHSLEGIGIVPDIYIRNTREEILNNYDHALETAIAYLQNSDN